MKAVDFARTCEGIPRYSARFRLTKVTSWLVSRGVRVGDMYMYHPNGVMLSENGNDSISPHASKFEFVEYVRVRLGPGGRYEVVGSHP
jgi:hypothetical protein